MPIGPLAFKWLGQIHQDHPCHVAYSFFILGRKQNVKIIARMMRGGGACGSFRALVD